MVLFLLRYAFAAFYMYSTPYYSYYVISKFVVITTRCYPSILPHFFVIISFYRV